jgi:hypothetical protein
MSEVMNSTLLMDLETNDLIEEAFGGDHLEVNNEKLVDSDFYNCAIK